MSVAAVAIAVHVMQGGSPAVAIAGGISCFCASKAFGNVDLTP
jgi:hypothetical protein